MKKLNSWVDNNTSALTFLFGAFACVVLLICVIGALVQQSCS